MCASVMDFVIQPLVCTNLCVLYHDVFSVHCDTELILDVMFVCVHFHTLNLFVQNGFAALHVACHKGHPRVAECLIDAKADLNLLTNVSTCYTVIVTMIHIIPHVCIKRVLLCGVLSLIVVITFCLYIT